MKRLALLSIALLLVTGCSSTTEKYTKYRSTEFQKEKYLGKWYEIARKDHWFEKNLSNVTAEYSIKRNGNIKVLNSGYNAKPDKSIENILRVSFFGPFYSDYIIVDYDKENYSYALVRSKKPEYLWILSRTPVLDKTIIDNLLRKASDDGLTVNDHIFVNQVKIIIRI